LDMVGSPGVSFPRSSKKLRAVSIFEELPFDLLALLCS
jgi:hypothetical protein